MSTTRTRTLKFNPRSLLLDCFAGSQTPTNFTARNESSYSGSPVNLRGQAMVGRQSSFTQTTLGQASTVLPMFKHQQLQNVGSAQDFVVQASQCYWFDAGSLALRGFTTYMWNIPYRPISFTNQLQLGDWFAVEDQSASSLAVPNVQTTATFTTSTVVYQSQEVPLTLRRRVLQDQSFPMPLMIWADPRRMGEIFSVPGLAFSCYLQLQTLANTDIIKYRWVNTAVFNGQTSWSPVEIWVSLNSRRIQAFKTTGDNVLVSPGPPLSLRIEPTRYTRLTDAS